DCDESTNAFLRVAATGSGQKNLPALSLFALRSSYFVFDLAPGKQSTKSEERRKTPGGRKRNVISEALRNGTTLGILWLLLLPAPASAALDPETKKPYQLQV